MIKWFKINKDFIPYALREGFKKEIVFKIVG